MNDSGEAKVTKQVLVSFRIGKYEDEVLCDVVPIQAGHLLLGRPWEFGQRVYHDSFTNKYSFIHNQRIVTLAPMTPKQVYEDQVRLQKLSDQENLSEQKNESEKRCESEHIESEGKERYTAKERTQSNFYAITSEAKRVLILKRINIRGRTEQHIKQAHKGFHRLVFEPRDWGWSQMRKERFHAQRRSKLKHHGGVDFRTNPSQEGGGE